MRVRAASKRSHFSRLSIAQAFGTHQFAGPHPPVAPHPRAPRSAAGPGRRGPPPAPTYRPGLSRSYVFLTSSSRAAALGPAPGPAHEPGPPTGPPRPRPAPRCVGRRGLGGRRRGGPKRLTTRPMAESAGLSPAGRKARAHRASRKAAGRLQGLCPRWTPRAGPS